MDVLQNEGRQKIYVEGETFDIPEWNGVCVVSLRQKKKKKWGEGETWVLRPSFKALQNVSCKGCNQNENCESHIWGNAMTASLD